MLRWFVLAIMALCVSLSLPLKAHAWKDITVGDARQTSDCLNETPSDECVTKTGRYVRTNTGTEPGTVPVRLLLRRNLPQDQFDALMRKYGMIEGKYHEWFVNAGDKDYYKRAMTLQGLTAMDGKTVLLPAEFTRVLPLSDRVALVRTVKNNWYFATLGPGETTLTELTHPWDDLQWFSGNEPKRPFMVMLRQYGETKEDLRSYTILDGDGEAAYTVSGVIPNTHGTDDYFTFHASYIGFPVRVDASEFSVIFNMITLELEKMGPVFDILDVGYALTEKWGDNKYDKKYYPFQKIGEMPSGKGLLSTDIFEPIDVGNAEPHPLSDPKATRGMVPLRLPGQIDGIRGWLMVYANATDQWYKLIMHAPKTDEYHADKLGRWDELTPSSVRVYLWEPNEYLPLADIWIGTISDETHKALFANANPKDIPPPSYRVAARFFENPQQLSAGGVTDWYLIGSEPSAENFQKIYDTRSMRASHPDNPQALATPELIAEMKKEWQAKAAYREYIETPWEVQVARAQAEQERTLLAAADSAISGGYGIDFNGDFYYIARTKGGKYLQAYWNKYHQLPRSADAYDICRRFGSSSMECNLVYAWADNISQGQREAARRDADRYSQKQFNQGYKTEYRPPMSEPRCYQTGAKTETCFYN
ncbi:hypothetical protein [Hyphomonas sp. GM-8P]|uniref:hypothetical protein n=1 Tax=Hyphomonas sp. GM-8P TaxID=1280945 RepID=UPI000DBF88BA|nr:hypothetical protein [Hyphomonas sp. GM-8P]RAN41373.1 hypothetical protein HY26_08530 [Hyphomonas sp. GM-8P]